MKIAQFVILLITLLSITDVVFFQPKVSDIVSRMTTVYSTRAIVEGYLLQSRLTRQILEPHLLLRTQNCTLYTDGVQLGIKNFGSYQTKGRIIVRGKIEYAGAAKYTAAVFEMWIPEDDISDFPAVDWTDKYQPSGLGHDYLRPGETIIVKIPDDCLSYYTCYFKKYKPIFAGEKYNVIVDFEFYSGFWDSGARRTSQGFVTLTAQNR